MGKVYRRPQIVISRSSSRLVRPVIDPSVSVIGFAADYIVHVFGHVYPTDLGL